MRQLLRWLKRTFLSGLLALLPLGLTLYLLWLLYRLAYSLLGPHTPFAALMRRFIGTYIPGTEVAMTVLVVLVVGTLARHWLGRAALRGVERVLLAVPGVRNLYAGMRQLSHVVLHREQALARGRRVVLVEFPQPGSYALGIVTNEDAAELSAVFCPGTVSVYIPTAPNPLSGYVLFLPRTKVFPAQITTEEALSLILSGGLVTRQPQPSRRSLSDASGEEAAD